MAVNRAEIVDQNFIRAVSGLEPVAGPGVRGGPPLAPDRPDLDAPLREGTRLTRREALALFEAMVASRHIDLQARVLKSRSAGFYTIGSSGHEGNAAVAAALRPTDPAFLHYRSGAFFMRRARQVPGTTPLLDVLLGIVASSDEPIAGGRHKVFGSVALNVPPQTSTIASHLPKAVGAAFSIARAKRLGHGLDIPEDSIVVCTFGDASSNHSTACGAFNTAALAHHQNLPCPLLFVCEDNGLGISTRTPSGWVARRFQADAGIKYFGGDGLDVADAFEVASAAVDFVRRTRRPALLHLRVVRLLGHAGSDVEQLYRTGEEIEAAEALDPVLATARMLVEHGAARPDALLALYEGYRSRCDALGREAEARPKLTTAAEVMRPLGPLREDRLTEEIARQPAAADRAAFFDDRLPDADRPRHMAMQLNRALADLLVKYPEMLVFGEDVARKGGVYHVTADLQRRAGVGRVFNTPLDETSILGLAIGAAQLGMLPVPEIQYLAYLHNAIDQIRGEAASFSFFSNDQMHNPMVVRIAALAYQRGFGGHFHNDNAIAALRDIPGLLIACPSNGRDAVGMLRTCVAAAKIDGRVTAFLEPIALYMTKDLHEERDGGWSFPYPEADFSVPVGRARTWTQGEDLTILSYANGLRMSLRVAHRLQQSHGLRCHVVDLRWLSPLPVDDMVRAATATGRVLIVDECRRTGGVAEGVMAALVERCPEVRMARVAGIDTFIPLGAAANLVLVQEADIEAAALEIMATEATA
jgi:2-oxoisovalerate dehydrogenase E1 component